MPTSAEPVWAADTSFAIAALDASHEAHVRCRDLARSRRPALAGHAAFETFSVLTRLPGAKRATPATVGVLLARAFPTRCWLSPQEQEALLERLPSLGVSGGMVYDALVAEAARTSKRVLLTRDARAGRTYELVGVRVEFVG
jgi:predicted nucleic acid-binding protein